MHEKGAFERFAGGVRARVDAVLAPWLAARVAEARHDGADAAAVADAVRQLVLRGGKRLRPVLAAAAHVACGGEAAASAVVMAGVSLELLQSYLLVHDDWMDGDELRRGGPSVPAMMRARFETGSVAVSCADAASVLAGDLAAAWAHAALLEADAPPDRLVAAGRELARAERDVVHGQVLDVRGAAGSAAELEAMHALKTASYTVRAPVVIGGRLAGASDAQVGALEAYARPLGVAFQLRDDLIGAFGEARSTGKPAADLRSGKRTAVVVEAMADARAAELLVRVLGRKEARDEDVAAALERVAACGASARIEGRIAALAAEARAALARASFDAAGRELLEDAAGALTVRER
jgi:geranylgeranyl diphosphate synthase type I